MPRCGVEQTCVRCGRSAAIETMDLVGTGHRCNACTAQVEISGEPDVVDNFDPATRETRAKKSKRRLFASVGASAGILGSSAGAGLLVGGPIGALIGGMLGMYFAGAVAGSAVDINYKEWKRYRGNTLPGARVRKLPPGDG